MRSKKSKREPKRPNPTEEKSVPATKKQSKIDALTERLDRLITVLESADSIRDAVRGSEDIDETATSSPNRLPGDPIQQPPPEGKPFTDEAYEGAIEMLSTEQEIPGPKEGEDSTPFLSLIGALAEGIKGQIKDSQFSLMHLALINRDMARLVLENLHKVFPTTQSKE